MSEPQSTPTESDESTEQNGTQPRNDNGQFADSEDGDTATDENSERDDHRVEVTLALDNAAAAHVAALRDADVPVGTILAQRLERPAEAVLYEAHQQRKYGQQQQQNAGGR